MSKGRKKGSGNGVSKTLTISLSPEQRDFLSRKLTDTGATLAGYIRALLDSSDGKRSKITVPESPSITITPAQRDSLSRKLEGTGATVAGYIRVLIEKDMVKKRDAGVEKEAQK